MTRPDRITAAERRALALRLRREGATFQEIADHLAPDGGKLYASRQGAQRAVARELRAIPAEDARLLRTMEAERLDAVQAAAWPQLEHGRAIECPQCSTVVARDVNLAAARIILAVSQRRAELLGLDYRHGLHDRAMSLMEQQVRLAHDAVEHGLTAAGIDDETRALVLSHMGDYLRALDEDPADDGMENVVPLTLNRMAVSG